MIPWMVTGLYTCMRNLNICSNSFCKMNTEINKKDVHKVYIESENRNSRYKDIKEEEDGYFETDS